MNKDTGVKFSTNEEIISTDSVVNVTLDNFAYSTVGMTDVDRFGEIAFFKYVHRWTTLNSAVQETHVAANIRMPEHRLVELARIIINQYEMAKKERESR